MSLGRRRSRCANLLLRREVVFVTPEMAHVIVRHATRLRADNSPIEVVSTFYALTRTPSGWKFFAFSDITVTV